MNITIHNVEQVYRNNSHALYPVHLELHEGVYGLLGPNGAGKSTLMNILTMAKKPTSGTVYCNGVDINTIQNEYKSKIGYLPQTFGLFPALSGREFLMYVAALKGLSKRHAAGRIQELLSALNLNEVGDQHIASYSGGMRQRIGIAQALLNNPKFLLLDEPSVGLDPDERVNLKNLITKAAQEATVIYSTHIVSDIEALAGSIIIMKQGRILAAGAVNQLTEPVEGLIWKMNVDYSGLATLQDKYICSSSNRSSDGIEVRVLSSTPPSAWAEPVYPTLEDVYLYLIHQDEIKGESPA
ncbi:ATP-binding cassette domain-containing protein [Paenibacillus sp. FSL L8-0470]|uniref:ATP-binding cassette domain-containing protein n=1 Tax=Paenibacillus sp. FSL L8-0470 TaxID=2954688 RepID=UPI0030F67362